MVGKRVIEPVAWGVVASGVWLATLSSITLPEALFAMGAALPCALAARATRRVLGSRWTFDARWLLLPVAVVVTAWAEFVPVITAALHGRSGQIRRQSMEPSGEAYAEGRAAVFGVALSATPGSLVIHDDPAHRQFEIHRLASAGHTIDALIPKVVFGESVVDR